MKSLQSYTSQIELELEKLALPHSPSNLYDPLRYFLKIGGKRMRPILTLMGAKAFGIQPEEVLPAALSIEIFHNFTLIHDDIMDQAPLRRGKETVHTKWNENIAILSGDVLFVKAYQALALQDSKHLSELLTIFNQTAIEVCEGQQMDMDFEERSNVTIPEYLEMIRLKTSVLLGCALKFSGILAGTTKENCDYIYDFGQYIGIAFQIQDDILDLYADPDKFGKQVGGDIISNKKTLLLLKAFELADKNQTSKLEKLLTEEEELKKIGQAKILFNEIGAKKACQDLMQTYYEKALTAIKKVSVEDSQKTELLALASYLMEREV
jgi:geranylgeranyl diphosphate synthase, type II